MKLVVFIATALAASCLAGRGPAADEADSQDADQQKIDQQQKALAPLSREVRQFVRQYYPAATVKLLYDKKRQATVLHFGYSTLNFRMPDPQDSGKTLPDVRGPYVGGIWCEMSMMEGRYKGPVPNAEKGTTRIGPDYYTHLVAPYSKSLDRHMLVVLRYPAGTSPEFLKRFETLVQGFDQYVKEPVK